MHIDSFLKVHGFRYPVKLPRGEKLSVVGFKNKLISILGIWFTQHESFYIMALLISFILIASIGPASEKFDRRRYYRKPCSHNSTMKAIDKPSNPDVDNNNNVISIWRGLPMSFRTFGPLYVTYIIKWNTGLGTQFSYSFRRRRQCVPWTC